MKKEERRKESLSGSLIRVQKENEREEVQSFSFLPVSDEPAIDFDARGRLLLPTTEDTKSRAPKRGSQERKP